VHPVYWNGWGVDHANSRFQPASMAGLEAAQVPRLKLKWSFGFPGASVAFGQPTVVAGRLWFGSADGAVYSVDARSGCIYWTYKAAASVRSAISVGVSRSGRYDVYFGDVQANVYALDAQTGALLWKIKVDDHPYARITGAPVLHTSRLFVPVSSVEEVPAGNAQYACCTFRGSLVAIDIEAGKTIWKTYTIPDPPKPTRKNTAGAQMHGPSGAAVWSPPTLDLNRRAVYVATGNGYSDPPTGYTDAILAFDMDTGSLRWAQQMTPADGWNFACISPNKASCPETAGEDFDFGAPPVLRDLPDGRSLLVVGQKSGIVHALDPDRKGKVAWQTRVGKGSALGGVEWGAAADRETFYVPVSDFSRTHPEAGGGLFALRIATGEKVWAALPPKPACLGKPGCSAAQMAPPTLIPGVVFSGSMDGHLRAYDTRDGKIIWDFDTLREFETVNGVSARGGSLNATGPTVAAGMVYANSGYGVLGGMPGNVLLAFSVDGK
jgi:polyvinyl alcohol dehydrogenase (cytochrome)